MRRPDFISESRQRLRRLAQQVEARKMQEALSRRREERLGRPAGAAPQLRPPGAEFTAGGEFKLISEILTWISVARQREESCSQEGDDPEI